MIEQNRKGGAVVPTDATPKPFEGDPDAEFTSVPVAPTPEAIKKDEEEDELYSLKNFSL